METGKIIILNGPPRAGKTSIAREIQSSFPGIWFNIGVDAFVKSIMPAQLLPGMGLRPGGERPELESFVATAYQALYRTIAVHSRIGLNVVADVGHHNDYAVPLDIYDKLPEILAGSPVFFVGVKCPIDEIMRRRDQGRQLHGDYYLTTAPGTPVPEPVLRWQEAVHRDMIYDLEVDTSRLDSSQCARQIRDIFDPGCVYNGLQESFRNLHQRYISRP